jgi:hypothetical protein
MSVSIETAAQRFADAGFQRADRYEQGTEGKGAAWAGAKARAKANFAPAMQEALSKNLYDKGLDKADAADYDAGVSTKGVANWGTGMQAGQAKYRERIQKFQTLWSQALPTAPGPRRSSANMKRMTENAQRFVAAAGK